MTTVKGPPFDTYGEPVAKFNYHQARKQNQVAQVRQQEKQQRRSAQSTTPDEQRQAAASQELVQARAPSPETGT